MMMTNGAYPVPPADTEDAQGEVKLYDEGSDSFVVIPYRKLLEQCRRFISRAITMANRRPRDDPLFGILIPEEIGGLCCFSVPTLSTGCLESSWGKEAA